MDTSPIDPLPNPPKPSEPNSLKLRLEEMGATSWQRLLLLGLGVVAVLVLPAIAGMMAVRNLLQIAEAPDCRAKLASDSTQSAQLYCADEIAKNPTVENLRDAIKLVSSIPQDDPLRVTGDRRIGQWSQELLNLGEKSYQEGDLDAAIRAAQVVPMISKVYPIAEERINQWKKSWEKAEDIFKETQNAIQRQEWTSALDTARGLVKLGNHYWETTRYQELLDQVQTGKEQEKAEKTAAEKVRSSRPVQGFTRWERGFEADAIARMRRAHDLARSGNVKGLKAAIEEAQQIYYGTPTYEEAQKQIGIWQRKADMVEDRYHLDRAMRLASRGSEDALQAAIDEAYMVSPTGSLYEEARSRIDQWMDQLYRMKYSLPDRSRPPAEEVYTIPGQPKLAPNSERL